MSKKKVRILYDYQHDEFRYLLNGVIAKLQENSDIEIKVDYAMWEFDKLLKNNEYDIVVMHLVLAKDEDLQRSIKIGLEAKENSKHYKPKIVAESSSYPWKRREILSGSFDHYMEGIVNMNGFTKLLKKYDFLPNDFQLNGNSSF